MVWEEGSDCRPEPMARRKATPGRGYSCRLSRLGGAVALALAFPRSFFSRHRFLRLGPCVVFADNRAGDPEHVLLPDACQSRDGGKTVKVGGQHSPDVGELPGGGNFAHELLSNGGGESGKSPAFVARFRRSVQARQGGWTFVPHRGQRTGGAFRSGKNSFMVA